MTKEKIEKVFDEPKEPLLNKEETKVVEEMAKKNAFVGMKYRYFCDACTNVAFKSDKIEEGLHGVCAVCGKPYTTRKENFILI